MHTQTRKILSSMAFEEEITKLHMKAHSFSIQPSLTKAQIEELEKMSKALSKAALHGDLVSVEEMNRVVMIQELVDRTLDKYRRT
jgi:hypothetical protein